MDQKDNLESNVKLIAVMVAIVVVILALIGVLVYFKWYRATLERSKETGCS